MGFLDHPDSTMLLVIMGLCVLGLVLIGTATLFPGLSRRLRRGRPTDAYPTEPVQLGARLTASGYEAAGEPPEREAVTVVAARQPAAKKSTPASKAATRKPRSAKKSTRPRVATTRRNSAG